MLPELDCVVVGFNSTPFATTLEMAKLSAAHSGAYEHLKANAALLEGERLSYPELFNRCFETSLGTPSRYDIFKTPQLGVFYLVNYLRKRDFRVEPINFFNAGKERLKELLDASPNAVAIATTFYTDPLPIVEIVSFIRQNNPTTKIIAGGTYIFGVYHEQPIEMQDALFELIGADIYVCDRRGESTLARICQALREPTPRLDRIPNLVFRAKDRAFERTPRERENNNPSENNIDWELFAEQGHVSKMALVQTARGCAYQCAFCRYPALEGRHETKNLDSVERELDSLKGAGVSTLLFVDDTFNIPMDRFKELCLMMIRKQYGFRWMAYIRCAEVDTEALDLAAQSGCMAAFLGIESGNQGVLRAMDKKATLEQFRVGISLLKERGITTHASVMFGFPTETMESAWETIHLLEETGVDTFNAEIYYNDCKSPIGLRKGFHGLKGTGYSWSHDTMNWQQAADLVIEAYTRIEGPLIVPLYRFSVWSLGYYASHGFQMSELMEFLRLAHPLCAKSVDESYNLSPSHEERMLSVFKDVNLENLHQTS